MIYDVFKNTSDDWYPSYLLNDDTKLVKVSFTQTGLNPPINGKWRVCVWGADDCGMEKDFTSEQEALFCFLDLIALSNITFEELSTREFISA